MTKSLKTMTSGTSRGSDQEKLGLNKKNNELMTQKNIIRLVKK